MDLATYETARFPLDEDAAWAEMGLNGWRPVGLDLSTRSIVMTREVHLRPCAFAACTTLVPSCGHDCTRTDCQQRWLAPETKAWRWCEGYICCSRECSQYCIRGWFRGGRLDVVAEAVEHFGPGWKPSEVTSAE